MSIPSLRLLNHVQVKSRIASHQETQLLLKGKSPATLMNIPDNGAKFDITQITQRSELLSQIRGSEVVRRDRIHRDCRITQ